MTGSLNSAFLESLGAMQLLFFWIAVFASAILILYLILSSFPALFFLRYGEKTVPFFSAKTICAFLAVGGWCAFAASHFIDNVWAPVLIFCAAGAGALVGSEYLFRALFKVYFNVFKSRATGADAVVSASVPPKRRGRGAITLFIKDTAENLPAVTDEEELIPVGTPVKILSYSDECALVCRLEKTKIGKAESTAPAKPSETGSGMHSE